MSPKPWTITWSLSKIIEKSSQTLNASTMLPEELGISKEEIIPSLKLLIARDKRLRSIWLSLSQSITLKVEKKCCKGSKKRSLTSGSWWVPLELAPILGSVVLKWGPPGHQKQGVNNLKKKGKRRQNHLARRAKEAMPRSRCQDYAMLDSLHHEHRR